MKYDTAPIYAIRQEVMHVHYPAKKQDLIAKVGDAKVGPLDEPVPLRSLIEAAPADKFESEEEAVRTVAQVWEQKHG